MTNIPSMFNVFHDVLAESSTRSCGCSPGLEYLLDDTAPEARRHLRGISSQAALRPALVLATADRGATVVLADGSTLELGADQGWGGRNPASLVKRGDISANVEMLPGDVLIIPQGWF